MSRLTLLIIAAAFAGPALAGQPLEDAQAKRSKAFNDFYNHYKASQHRPEDVDAIRSQTIAPSNIQVGQALTQEKVQALKSMGVQTLTPAEANALHERMSKQLDEDEASNDGADSAEDSEENTDGKPGTKTAAAENGANRPSLTGGRGVNPARKPAAPETVIDGKAIPKEITFGNQE